jgi:hypothetical protein
MDGVRVLWTETLRGYACRLHRRTCATGAGQQRGGQQRFLHLDRWNTEQAIATDRFSLESQTAAAGGQPEMFRRV